MKLGFFFLIFELCNFTIFHDLQITEKNLEFIYLFLNLTMFKKLCSDLITIPRYEISSYD